MRNRRIGSGELFPTDEPIPADRMIGREDDVDAVAGALIGGANIILAGPRRTGKTSVADAALEVCAGEGCATVTVDLFLLGDADELVEEIAIAAIANRPALKQAVQAAGRNVAKLRDALNAAATYRARADLGEDLEIALSIGVRPQPGEKRLRAALEMLERIAVADDRRVVLFLDEFQEIASGRFGKADVVTRRMRAILQRSPHVSVLFAGSVEHLMRDLFAPGDRALSQFGAFHELHEITDAQWAAGLRARLAEDRCTISESALERLIAAGEHHPRATMLVAQQTHQAAVEQLARQIDDALVVDGERRALRSDRLKHEQSLERIRAISKHAQRMAQRVAHGARLYEGLNTSAAARALNGLRDAGLIEQTAHGQWRVIDPLLRRYLMELRGPS